MTNGQINKCFTHGVVSWLKHGIEFDRAKYAIYYDKYNVEFIERGKIVNITQQVESGVVHM